MGTRRTVVVLSVLLGIAVLVIAGLVWSQLGGDDEDDIQITSFDECVAAGFPVMETDPPQCRTDDGRTFTGPRATPSPTAPSAEPTEEPPSGELTSEKGVTIVIDSPVADDTVSSPVDIRGSVPGSWSFEASFGVEVLDANGDSLGEGPAELLGDWMTEEMVEFQATVEFTAPTTETGTIVLHRANPADDPATEDSLSLPIRFAP